MKLVHGELEHLMLRCADVVRVINHVRANGYHSAVVFKKFTVSESFAAEANAEFARYGESVTAGEHCFITIVSTYGKVYNDYSENTKYKQTFEVTRDEGNQIYMKVLNTKVLEYLGDRIIC